MAETKLVANTSGSLYMTGSSLSTDKCGYTATAGVDPAGSGSGFVSYGGSTVWWGGNTPTIKCTNDYMDSQYRVHLGAMYSGCNTFDGWYLDGKKVSSDMSPHFLCKKCCQVGRYLGRFIKHDTCDLAVSVYGGGGVVLMDGRSVSGTVVLNQYETKTLTAWADSGKTLDYWTVFYSDGTYRDFYAPDYSLSFTCSCGKYWSVIARFKDGSGSGGWEPGGSDIDPYFVGSSCSGGKRMRLLAKCPSVYSAGLPTFNYYYKSCINGKVKRFPESGYSTVHGWCNDNITINGVRYQTIIESQENISRILAIVHDGGSNGLVQTYMKVGNTWKWV